MCGIWGYFTSSQFTSKEMTKIYESFYNVKPRGPDNSSIREINDFINSFIGFHRLSIMDRGNKANQPFELYKSETKTTFISCNGEIYNYKKLLEEEKYVPETGSDCEAIKMLYVKYGLKEMMKRIDGEFAISIIELDRENQISVHLIRDHIGIRPLYYGFDSETHDLIYASDLKGTTALSGNSDEAHQIVKNVEHVKPGYCVSVTWQYNSETKTICSNKTEEQYYSFKNNEFSNFDLEETRKKINSTLREAVVDRLMTERPLGSLLSGGLDSSLVSAIAAEKYNKEGRKLQTFSVGMPGATDKVYAEMVAKHIGSKHTHVEFTEEDFLNAIEQTIWTIGSYDITTIRASVGLVLISQWISKNTDVKVLMTGEGADELNSGYMYFHNAPCPKTSHEENHRLLGELYYYDLLRGDRSIADFGLEARIPFLDRKFMKVILSTDPKLRIPTAKTEGGQRVEKWLLRSAFQDDNLLPDEVLWRKKEAFSDGVSGEKRSWFEVIQEHAEKKYSDAVFKEKQASYSHLPPTNKESLYFREIFEKLYGKNVQKIVPHYWLPLWSGNITEPSARVLGAYQRDE
jgi:asparagine synthase (glutamine-hydrolysing)